MHGCQPFFITKSRAEAERLLPIIATGNGGKRCFEVKEFEETLAFPASVKKFAIHFNAGEYSKYNPNAPERNAARWRARMASFLQGYLYSEALARKADRAVSKARADHRNR